MNPEQRTDFAGFVLRDLVLGVLFAVLAFAVGAAGFWNIDLLPESISIDPTTFAPVSNAQSSTYKSRVDSEVFIMGS